MSEDQTLFHIVYVAGVQEVGEPVREVDGPLRLEFTPASLRRLISTLKPQAIEALLLLIEHGFRPGKPIAVDGFSVNWLIDMGMTNSRAGEAVKQLLSLGYVNKYRIDGQVTGRQIGALAANLYGVETEYDGVPRTDGRPRRPDPADVADHPENRDNEIPDTASMPVDIPVSDFSGNGTSRHPGSQDAGQSGSASSQVSPVSDFSGNGDSAPSSSSVGEEVLLHANADNQDFAWLGSYLRQPSLVAALRGQREASVLALSRAVGDFEMTAAPLVRALGVEVEGRPASRSVACLIVEAICGEVDVRPLLDRINVHNRRIEDDHVVSIAFVAGLITALSADVKVPGGWFGRIVNRREFLVNRAAGQVLTAMDSVLLGDVAHNPVQSRPVQQSADDLATLVRAAIGTPWLDGPVDFAQLLRNRGRQVVLRSQWEVRSPEEKERLLAHDRHLHETGADVITYQSFLEGARWDVVNETLVPPPG